MRYQVVFQFPETFFATHSDLVAFEDELTASMPKTCDVDGYDVGSGTANFFVLTDSPLAAFKQLDKSKSLEDIYICATSGVYKEDTTALAKSFRDRCRVVVFK